MAEPPASILIIGAGVFGLSTAHALLTEDRYKRTRVTILDAYVPPPSEESSEKCTSASSSANAGLALEHSATLLSASLDSSRIVRADYASAAYAQLADRAQVFWERGWPYERSVPDEPLTPLNHNSPTPLAHASSSLTYASSSSSSSPPPPPRVYHPSSLLVTANNPAANSNPRGADYVRSSLANVRGLHDGAGVKELPDRAAIRAALYGVGATERCDDDVDAGSTDAAVAATGADDSTVRDDSDAKDDSAIGDFGYQNTQSAWADASGAMAGLRRRVRQRGHARTDEGGAEFAWRSARVEQLVFETKRKANTSDTAYTVRGARLTTGEVVPADLTIVAAGAWSAALLPRSLHRRVRASGQPVAYVELQEHERQQLAGRPVMLNIGTALFSIPPPARDGDNDTGASTGTKVGTGTAAANGINDGTSDPPKAVLKAAQHGWGYGRKVMVDDIEPEMSADGTTTEPNNDAQSAMIEKRPDDTLTSTNPQIELSIPPTTATQPIPAVSKRILTTFLSAVYPHVLRHRPTADPFTSTRLCWYADTPSGDFLVDFVPAYGRSALVASGGSGHGFKFAPVLGSWVLGVLEGRWTTAGALEEEEDRGVTSDGNADDTDATLGRRLARLWRWRSDAEIDAALCEPGDGSRGGERDLVWTEDMV